MIKTILAATASLIIANPAAAQQRSVVNVSGLEYSSDSNAKVYYNYVPPSNATLAAIKANRFWGIRLPISEEQLQPDPSKAARGLLNETYLAVVLDAATRAQKSGLTVIVDIHNYGQYYGNNVSLTSSTDPTRNIRAMYLGVVGSLAKRLQVAGVWGLSVTNEPHAMSVADVQSVEQDAVNTARAAGFRGYLFVDDAGWATASDGIQITVRDPSGTTCYDVHAYGDGNGSGTYKVPYAQDIDVSTGNRVNADTIVNRLAPAVNQAKREKRCLFVGEIGAPLGDSNRLQQVMNAATYLKSNGVDWAYWVSGEWTGNDPNSLQSGLTSSPSAGARQLLATLPSNR